MDALSHFHLGQEYAAKAGQILKGWGGEVDLVEASAFAALAQVHATLALAGVTALNDADGGMPVDDHRRWGNVVSVAAPIPPETDDEPDEDPITEGSMSPGRDDDPDVFAGWMRAVPPGSTLTDVDGDGWYRIVSLDTATNRTHPTLVAAGGTGGGIRNIDERDDMINVQIFAPFTVLTVGTADGA